MHGQDQPKIYTIRDHTLEVLMHPDVLELHAVRVVHILQGDERQLHLKVRVRCGQEELVVDVLVDTGAQVSLVRRGLFKEESLQPSRRPVRLKVANREIMGGGTHEAIISMEFWQHERLNRPDLAKRSTLSGNFSPRILWGPKIPKPATIRNTTFFVKLYHKEHIFRR